MKYTYNKFLIIIAIILFTSGIYLPFSDYSKSIPFIKIAEASSLSSSKGFIASAFSALSSSDKISTDTSFLNTLTSLKKIIIGTNLFSSKTFIALKNNSVKIEQVLPGRTNPFSPIGVNNNKESGVVPPSKIVTDQPTGITDKTAVFNGTINVTNETANAYFEYGITKNLGSVTPTIQPSLVGTFIKNVLGLTSKTDYFYRACAKINNIANCGEVVLFKTN